MEILKGYTIRCEARTCGNPAVPYTSLENSGICCSLNEISSDGLKTVYQVIAANESDADFLGVLHIKVCFDADAPKFFMPGYMYNRNTADMPSIGRKAFPRIRHGAENKPESEFFMTRSDRLAEPVSLLYDCGRVLGISGAPCIYGENDEFVQFAGFTCNIDDGGGASVGYTLGYENAPWLFVQSATVLEREPVSGKNAFTLLKGDRYTFEISVYDYQGEDERAVYRAIEDVYGQFHEGPRRIEGMDARKAVELLSGAIRDYAWLEDEQQYTGFVYDCPDGNIKNRIPSVSWTNGFAVALPMLMAANALDDSKAREQSLTFFENVIHNWFNEASGFLYESVDNGNYTPRGWWYSGMHSGGHSGYINGQAVYYILKGYLNEKEKRGIEHGEWLNLAAKIVLKMNLVMNTDYEYPFAMSEKTGAGLEYDSLGSAWCLAASAMFEAVSGDRSLVDLLKKSEEHYYESFVRRVECYGGPLDTDKAVDSEGILSFIRAARLMHELTGEEYMLDHLRDALYYEFTFKLGYNTHVQVRPLSEIGWSSCGGSITSTANPHIHPMSSTVVDEMRYYLRYREDKYVSERLEDTINWGLQTFNTKESEYGYGRIGWMSERFCFCEGLLTEHYPDGEVASTWFALMPWASGSIIEGLCALL